MTPSNFVRSAMLLSSTARTATTKRASNILTQQSWATVSISRRSISTSRSFLSVNKSRKQLLSSQSSSFSTSTSRQTTAQINSNADKKEENPTSTTQEKQTEETYPPNLTLATLRQYPYTLKTGTVTSVGLMNKTVRVAYQHREWDRNIRKYYPKTTTYLVSDPRDSLREGDVIEFSSGAPKSRRVRHVVERIISPFGVGVEDRPAIMSREEREALRVQKRVEKLARKADRVAAAAAEKTGSVSAGGKEEVDADASDNAESVKRRFLESKDHIGRIRSLVLERTNGTAAAATSAT